MAHLSVSQSLNPEVNNVLTYCFDFTKCLELLSGQTESWLWIRLGCGLLVQGLDSRLDEADLDPWIFL